MKQTSRVSLNKKIRIILIGLTLPCLALAILAIANSTSASRQDGSRLPNGEPANAAADPNLPPQIDVRGGTPRGLELRQPTAVQLRALTSLQNLTGTNLNIRYNGLTATPMFLGNPEGYLTAPSAAPPEQIARDFIRQWQEIFRFTDSNLDNLKLVSRAVSQEGTTVMLFQQQANNLPVYHGEVLVNVSKSGQIISVGGDSFPRLNVTNAVTISPATAVSLAAGDLGVSGFTPVSLGATNILATYGSLAPEYAAGQKFDKNVFSDDVSVQQIIFPLGDTGRIAYKFNLVTPQYHGIMWQNIVDAQTGTILKRTSLTSYFGEPGGGNTIPRKGTFRPDVQNALEANNAGGTAQGKVFDTMPVTLSKVGGTGRAVRTGTAPGNYMIARPAYDPDTVFTTPFRYGIVNPRYENPLPFLNPNTPQLPQPLTPSLLGQLTRGFPDAANPNSSSPFGWFYLPTNSNGTEIDAANLTTGTTRTLGYTMAAEAKTRNLAVNSPGGDGNQPFAADLTAIPSKTLPDGRVLTSVFQSRYTEGNNVSVSDDHQSDNDATRGIRGYSPNRQFTASHFDYYAGYELGGIDASGGGTGSTTPVTYPATANPDVYPDTVNLFYFNNLEHDYLYGIGFTEPFWNFQFDNFGKGGAGNDGIVAEVQDGSGTDNANMGTPAEGASPRMQMYLFTDGGFRRSDGDLDWDVVAHEHYHGVSNRSAAKGGDSCLGTPLVGESGGMGEGWSDAIASSLSDDDSEGEYVTGQFDNAIRRLPATNYRYSYGSINDASLNVRKNTNTDVIGPDQNPGGVPYEVHDIGEVWAAVLWDVRELAIMKDPNGMFFDGNKRLGGGAPFYIGNRLVRSVDLNHPINYRQSFATDSGTTTPFVLPADPTLNGARDIVRPGALAAENAANPQRSGPLANAVSKGARLTDKITLRGIQIAPCNPTFVDMRDSMLAADREISGGENQAIMWRAFGSHGIGVNATSSGRTNGTGQQGAAAAIVEDFTVPQGVIDCETLGPLDAPAFTLSNTANNTVRISISPVAGAANYVIARSTNANGPFTTIQTITGTTYDDNDNGAGLVKNQTYYYQVHAARSAFCVGLANTANITVTVGAALSPAPVFAGLGQVADPKSGNSLTLSWSAAASANPGANIVYDIYRVNNVPSDTDTTVPSFTPNAANLLVSGISATSYINTGLTLGQQYYYIVQARDTTNAKIDSNNLGNMTTKFNAPSTNSVTPTAPFALETFDNATTASARFTPMLVSAAAPDRSMPVFQLTSADLGGPVTSAKGAVSADAAAAATGVMFAPDYDPGNAQQGGPSDFFTQINPTGLTRASFLEFDHKFGTEATFDGNNLEIVLGDPALTTSPTINNVTTFDLNDYIVQNGYTNSLNGSIQGVPSSSLQGRRSFTGSKSLSHVRAAIGDFAPGGVKNPNSLPVYIRFHASSDAGTFVDGWYIDNLAVNNFAASNGLEGDIAARPNGDNQVVSNDVNQIRRFLNGTDAPDPATNEFQRADTAPIETLGDGAIQSNDVVQIRRYVNGADAYLTAGGPTAAVATLQTAANQSGKSSKRSKISGANAPAAPRELRIESTTGNAGQTVTVNLRVDAMGDESEYGFWINYDRTMLTNPVIGQGNAGAATRSCNSATSPGIIKCSVGAFPNDNPASSSNGIGEIAAGNNQILLTVTFYVSTGAANGATPLTITNQNASNDASALFIPTATNGSVTLSAANRQLRVENASTGYGKPVTVNVRVDAVGDEAEYAFIVNYDPAVLMNPRVGASPAGAGAVGCNTGTSGKVNCSIGAFPNNNSATSDPATGEIAYGNNQIIVPITFTAVANSNVSGATTTPVTLTNANVSNDAARILPLTTANGTVTISSPTAATVAVSGKALNAQGRGIGRVQITMTDSGGKTRTTFTNPFGFYNFGNVEAGKTYIFSAKDKRYRFSQPSQLVNLNEDRSDINFVAQ